MIALSHRTAMHVSTAWDGLLAGLLVGLLWLVGCIWGTSVPSLAMSYAMDLIEPAFPNQASIPLNLFLNNARYKLAHTQR